MCVCVCVCVCVCPWCVFPVSSDDLLGIPSLVTTNSLTATARRHNDSATSRAPSKVNSSGRSSVQAQIPRSYAASPYSGAASVNDMDDGGRSSSHEAVADISANIPDEQKVITVIKPTNFGLQLTLVNVMRCEQLSNLHRGRA